jgi:site-specific recombinase XerD
VLGHRSISTTANSTSRTCSLRPHVRATLVDLLASTGLLVGEEIRLRVDDVVLDSDPSHVVVRETKFHKTRIVPLYSTVADFLRSYTDSRKRLG